MSACAMYVVETYSGEAYIGQIEFELGRVVIYNGFVGRPPSVPQSDIESVIRADLHPDVTPA